MIRGNPHAVPALVLYPSAADYAPGNPSAYHSSLAEAGFLGAHWRADRYLVGEEFLDLVTFLGCAPDIELAPLADPDDLRFCHIRIPDPSDAPNLLASRHLQPPKCPLCSQTLGDFDPQKPLTFETPLHCEKCDNPSPAGAWRWRKKQMCFSRFRIEICNIYESEAVPTPGLINVLENIDQQSWGSCYISV